MKVRLGGRSTQRNGGEWAGAEPGVGARQVCMPLGGKRGAHTRRARASSSKEQSSRTQMCEVGSHGAGWAGAGRAVSVRASLAGLPLPLLQLQLAPH